MKLEYTCIGRFTIMSSYHPIYLAMPTLNFKSTSEGTISYGDEAIVLKENKGFGRHYFLRVMKPIFMRDIIALEVELLIILLVL